MRKTITGMLAVGTLIATGCGGGSTFANKPRPPTPINLTVYINNARVSISPASIGAGPVVFIVTNQASHASHVERPPRRRVRRPTGRRHRPDQPPGDLAGDRRPEQAGQLHADDGRQRLHRRLAHGAADDPAGDAAHRSAATEFEQPAASTVVRGLASLGVRGAVRARPDRLARRVSRRLSAGAGGWDPSPGASRRRPR